MTHVRKRTLLMTPAVVLLLAGCFGGEEEKSVTATPSAVAAPTGGTASPPPAPPPNGKPQISGTPVSEVRVGETYDFRPAATDPDGDALTFSVSNKPAWASFEVATGRLSGTPQAGDVGTIAGVVISVSDGKDAAALNGFNITVNQIALGAATLSWTPPTENTDGSPLTDLAGYKIYYGRDPATLDQAVVLGNPGLTSYVIENLSAATWYFSMSSLNSRGVESERSTVASKQI